MPPNKYLMIFRYIYPWLRSLINVAILSTLDFLHTFVATQEAKYLLKIIT